MCFLPPPPPPPSDTPHPGPDRKTPNPGVALHPTYVKKIVSAETGGRLELIKVIIKNETKLIKIKKINI